MTDVDSDLALHCLQELGKECPIVTQRNNARAPSPACEGLSIRDTLFDFLVQAIEEQNKPKYAKKKNLFTLSKLHGQIQALSYAVALIDNPYRVDSNAVLLAARMEVENRTI